MQPDKLRGFFISCIQETQNVRFWDPLIEVFQTLLDDIYLCNSYRLKNNQLHAAFKRWLLL